MAEEVKCDDEIKVSSSEVKNADSKEVVVVDIKDDQKSTTNSSSNSNDVCRICLESSPQSIVALGCDCRGELGFSHTRCAATWFSIRGNRECEICGKTVKNIDDNRIVRENWRVSVVRERRQVEVEVEDGRMGIPLERVVIFLFVFFIISMTIYSFFM